jgi:hypothetical protein
MWKERDLLITVLNIFLAIDCSEVRAFILRSMHASISWSTLTSVCLLVFPWSILLLSVFFLSNEGRESCIDWVERGQHKPAFMVSHIAQCKPQGLPIVSKAALKSIDHRQAKPPTQPSLTEIKKKDDRHLHGTSMSHRRTFKPKYIRASACGKE